MNIELSSGSSAITEIIASKIGDHLKGGEVIVLISELGGGKTTFTHGLAKAIGSKDRVASPTFTISRLYNGEKLDIYHFDFYRLNEAGLMKHELNDVLFNPKNVVVIEWPEVVSDVIPEEYLKVEIINIDDTTRKLLFTYPKSLSYLMSEYVDTSS